ncbi:MAG: hypothetical protein ABI024_02725 [Vicinamibacterales bacterium]
MDAQTNTGDIWLLDLVRNAVSRLTCDRFNDATPMWSPDGSRVLFRSNRSGTNSLYERPANATEPESMFLQMPPDLRYSINPSGPSRDGAQILLTVVGTSFDVWDLRVGAERRPTPVLQTAFNEYQAVLSPDGRWMALGRSIGGGAGRVAGRHAIGSA